MDQQTQTTTPTPDMEMPFNELQDKVAHEYHKFINVVRQLNTLDHLVRGLVEKEQWENKKTVLTPRRQKIIEVLQQIAVTRNATLGG